MWRRGRRENDRPLTPVGARFVDETESFLSGTFAQEMRARGDAVPGWARLNVLAHGDLATIEGLRQSSGATAPAYVDEDDAWSSAVRVLATELAALVEGDAGLLMRIQRSVLVPLELRLIQVESRRTLTAPDLVQATRAALRSSIA